MAYKRQIDRLPIIPKDAKEFNVTCHYCIVGCGYKAYTWPTNKQGGTARGPEQVRRRPRQAATSRDGRVVLARDVQHRAARTAKTCTSSSSPTSDCVVNSGLGSVRGARMAEMSYSQQRNTAAATPHRSDGVALRPDAADELGRCARSRRARHRRGHQRHGRGRAVRLRLRPRRRRRRLRKHLGHRQALFRRDEDQEHPDPQPARPTIPRSTPRATWAWAN